ncbi:MAG: leucine-rich repeat domain-containing protein [Janthinobacterium sp.]|jgi:Leucine-rich repeat (LRR) protein
MKHKIFYIIAAGLLLSGCSLFPTEGTKEVNLNNSVANESRSLGENKLDLSNLGLTKVPGDVFNQSSLLELNLSNNQLTGAVQSQIGNLQNLRVLNLRNNLMTGVPAEIGQLQNLQVLDLSNNKLTGLPNELGNLKNLKTFNISGNSYSAADLNTIIERLPAGVNIIK